MDKKKSGKHTMGVMNAQTSPMSVGVGAAEILEEPPLIMRLGQRIAKEFEARTAVKTATKPVMRGLLQRAIRRNLIVGCILAGASGLGYRQFVAVPRKKAYAEYYRTLDAEKQFQEMRRRGVFQSC